MSGRSKLKIYKENQQVQRSDIQLTKAIAITLVRKIFSGETLFPPEGYSILTIEGASGEETQVKLLNTTLNKWVSRENVLPNGNSLRGVLNKARTDYRAKKREELKDKLVNDAEAVLNRTLNIRSNVPVRNMWGKLIKNEDGSIARRENPDLLRVKVDIAKYVTERLDPTRYGKLERGEHKHLTFSLSDLRRYVEKSEKVGYEENATDQPCTVLEGTTATHEFGKNSFNQKTKMVGRSTPKLNPILDFSKLDKKTIQKLKEKLGDISSPRKTGEQNISYAPTGDGVDIFNAGSERQQRTPDFPSFSSI